MPWAAGCGVMAVVALICAMLGAFLDIVLVVRAQRHCLGELDAGEGLAGFVWAASRLVVLPVVACGSALASLPISLIAHLPRFAGHGWLKAVLLAPAVLVAVAGPAAAVLYDVASGGGAGGCVPPCRPAWPPL